MLGNGKIISMLANKEFLVLISVCVLISVLWVTFYFLTCLQVKVIGPDNKPVTNEPVYLFVNDSHNITLTTDKKGMASFSLGTSLWNDSVNLRVGYSVIVAIFVNSV